MSNGASLVGRLAMFGGSNTVTKKPMRPETKSVSTHAIWANGMTNFGCKASSLARLSASTYTKNQATSHSVIMNPAKLLTNLNLGSLTAFLAKPTNGSEPRQLSPAMSSDLESSTMLKIQKTRRSPML